MLLAANPNGLLLFPRPQDRKSTRLNSSHGYISYAAFCLKKKKISPPFSIHHYYTQAFPYTSSYHLFHHSPHHFHPPTYPYNSTNSHPPHPSHPPTPPNYP